MTASLMPAADSEWVGSETCSACHLEIYETYMRTPMAGSSGLVGKGTFQERFDRAEFLHQPSGYRYRVRREGQRYFFEFEKGAGASRVTGSRTLAYFVGSGAVARSYLLSFDGFLFEAPVTYYSDRKYWNLPPGFDRQNTHS